MTYPQPSASQYVTQGAKFFRLNTPLVSGGDIYESEVGCQAFVIGPESDVSRVRVTYFDEQFPTFANSVVIGSDRAFVGRLDASVRDQYVPANRPGRILIAPDNLWTPTLLPFGVTDITQITYVLVPPVLDVIQYFNDPGALVAGRNDKVTRFEAIPWTITSGGHLGNIYLMVPFFGRRFCSFDFQSDPSLGPNITVAVSGINLSPNTNKPIQLPLASVAPAASATISGAYSVGQTPASGFYSGSFDYLQFEISPDVNTNLSQRGVYTQIVVSDTPVPA